MQQSIHVLYTLFTSNLYFIVSAPKQLQAMLGDSSKVTSPEHWPCLLPILPVPPTSARRADLLAPQHAILDSCQL